MINIIEQQTTYTLVSKTPIKHPSTATDSRGCVFLATKDGTRYALEVTQVAFETMSKLLTQFNEQLLKRACNTEHLLKYKEGVKASYQTILVSEYCHLGDMLQYHKTHLPGESQARYFAKQLFIALHTLHEVNIIHGALDLEALMLTTNSSGDVILKVAHYGQQTTKPGTKEDDVFRAGIITYQLLFGVHPSQPADGSNDVDVRQLQKRLRMLGVSRDTYSFFTRVFHPDPSKRLTATEALQHPFLTSLPLPLSVLNWPRQETLVSIVPALEKVPLMYVTKDMVTSLSTLLSTAISDLIEQSKQQKKYLELPLDQQQRLLSLLTHLLHSQEELRATLIDSLRLLLQPAPYMDNDNKPHALLPTAEKCGLVDILFDFAQSCAEEKMLQYKVDECLIILHRSLTLDEKFEGVVKRLKTEALNPKSPHFADAVQILRLVVCKSFHYIGKDFLNSMIKHLHNTDPQIQVYLLQLLFRVTEKGDAEDFLKNAISSDPYFTNPHHPPNVVPFIGLIHSILDEDEEEEEEEDDDDDDDDDNDVDKK